MDSIYVCTPVEAPEDHGKQWCVFRVIAGGAREFLESFRRYPDAMRLMRQLRQTEPV